MYERRTTRPLTRPQYLQRLANHGLIALGVIAASLLLGMWGYHVFEQDDWVDAFLNAAMLLGGEGPIGAPRTESGKIFAGLYALYSGIAFLAVASILIAPIAHRLLHRFHWEDAHR